MGTRLRPLVLVVLALATVTTVIVVTTREHALVGRAGGARHLGRPRAAQPACDDEAAGCQLFPPLAVVL